MSTLIAGVTPMLAAHSSSVGVQVAAFATESEARAAAALLAIAPDVTEVAFRRAQRLLSALWAAFPHAGRN